MNRKSLLLALLCQPMGVLFIAANNKCPKAAKWCNISRFSSKDEREPAYKRRVAAACLRTLGQKRNNIECENNGDEKTVPFFAANFSKTLEHDSNGILTANGQANYLKLVHALQTGLQSDFNAMSRAPGAVLKLVNPQGALAFSLEGADSSLFKIPVFPTLSSPQAAAQMIEAYLMELCRDVFFIDYGTGANTDFNPSVPGNSLTNYAANTLQALGSAYQGPRNPVTGMVDASVIFKNNSFSSTYNGALVGPYVSQFFLWPVRTNLSGGIGAQVGGDPLLCFFTPHNSCLATNPNPFIQNNQLRPVSLPSTEFVVSLTDFVKLQNGVVPQLYNPALDFGNPCTVRHMIDGRDTSSFVHFDNPYECFYNAVTILVAAGFPLSPTNPYANGSAPNEAGFVTLAGPDVFDLLGTACDAGLKAAWAQKWRADRTLRPEEFGGLVQLSKSTNTNPFNLDSSLLNSSVLPLIFNKNLSSPHNNSNPLTGSWLLSQVYPEGCPIHPSYPQGHGSIAGACITIIKAFFDDTVKLLTDPRIPTLRPVVPDPSDPTALTCFTGAGASDMTLATELDKLASNIAQGRNFAGVHWRADADYAVQLGEQVAIKVLQDHMCTYTENTFKGFELTKVDGTRVLITATCVTPL